MDLFIQLISLYRGLFIHWPYSYMDLFIPGSLSLYTGIFLYKDLIIYSSSVYMGLFKQGSLNTAHGSLYTWVSLYKGALL